jgi:hypothetical protein
MLHALMKEMVNMGTRFIGFHDETESLRNNFPIYLWLPMLLYYFAYNPSLCSRALHLAEERAIELEKKLKARKKAHIDAEAKAATVDELRDKLHAAEIALSEKEEKIAKREATIVARLDTQSARFSGNVSFPFRHFMFVCLQCLHIYIEKYLFFQQQNW